MTLAPKSSYSHTYPHPASSNSSNLSCKCPTQFMSSAASVLGKKILVVSQWIFLSVDFGVVVSPAIVLWWIKGTSLILVCSAFYLF